MNPRQFSNIEICKMLTEYFSKPETSDIRFIQGLWNLGVIDRNNEIALEIRDRYSDESATTERTVRNNLAKLS